MFIPAANTLSSNNFAPSHLATKNHATRSHAFAQIKPVSLSASRMGPGVMQMSASPAPQRLVAAGAGKEPLILADKARQIVAKHWQNLAADLNQLKEEQGSRLVEKRDEIQGKTSARLAERMDSAQTIAGETRQWADEIKSTAATKAPGFLQADPAKDKAMLASFQAVIQNLAKDVDYTPNVLILNGENSPLFMARDVVGDIANVSSDLPEGPLDVVVVDGLLEKGPVKAQEKLSQAQSLVRQRGYVVVINQHNPSHAHLDMSKHVLNAAKGRFFPQVCGLTHEAVKQQGLTIQSDERTDHLQTLVAHKPADLGLKLAELTQKFVWTLESGVARAASDMKTVAEFLDKSKTQNNAPPSESDKS